MKKVAGMGPGCMVWSFSSNYFGFNGITMFSCRIDLFFGQEMHPQVSPRRWFPSCRSRCKASTGARNLKRT